MTITFDKSRWDRIKEDSDRWWAHELKRPLIQLRQSARRAKKLSAPEISADPRHLLYNLSVPVAAVVDAMEAGLSRQRFYGDAFPAVWPNMGPGVLAAFMGGKPVDDDETVWFFPDEEREIADIHFRFDPDNVWFNRLLSVCRLANERWQGLVQIGMTDLGGNLDILSTFRPSEKLLLDLYDAPGEVKRLTWDAHEEWWKCYDAVNAVLRGPNPGYTGWLAIFSTGTFYVLQCDFCYMIGPGMFDEFVRPELAASCARLANSFYHLDGVGELPHLDSLLSIEDLGGIQWVYGDGKPGVTHWPDLYRQILDAGKLLWLSATPAQFEEIVRAVGTSEGMLLTVGVSEDDMREPEIKEFLAKYGVL